MWAYVYMNTNPETAKQTAEVVSKIDGVLGTDVTTGRFDIVATVERDLLDLSSLEGPIMNMRRVPSQDMDRNQHVEVRSPVITAYLSS